jgi:hypothetical protein
VALSDIRYVQTEIEKILNRTSKGQRADNADSRKPNAEGRKSNDSLKSSLSKPSNFSTTPRKKPEPVARNTSPKRKKSDVIKVDIFPASPPPTKSIFTIVE